MKKFLLPLFCLMLLLSVSCSKDTLTNTVWLNVDSVVMTNGDFVSSDSITLDFVDNQSAHYKKVHTTKYSNTTERATFFYTYTDGHGQFSIKSTYDFEVVGNTMLVRHANDTTSDTIVFNKIYSE
ncbi:MAG: hypothetical protein SPJ13_05730 [Bacteroidales bacterium]|nr:hypothetical protein [Bacteroidales bacterium]